MRRDGTTAHIALIADDLTGAMDSGLQFGKRGLETLVSMSWEHLPAAEVLVVDTDSRDTRAGVAYARVRRVAEALAVRPMGGPGATRVYKKVDSTMRGNVGYELRGLLDALRPEGIAVAPAFPRGGRSTVGGVQRVDGRPLELTFFAHDPRWPMRESHLPTLLMQQAGREVSAVGLEIVERGPQRVAEALRAAGRPIIVVDAVTQAHLAAVAEALVVLGPKWLPCGSAGLAEEWCGALTRDERSRADALPDADEGPALLVAGSRNDVTVKQVRCALEERDLACLEPDPDNWWDLRAETARLANGCYAALSAGRNVALTACFLPLIAGRGDVVAELLGTVTGAVLQSLRLGGLVLTGGDIAVATCRALGTQGLRIRHEVQPGVPGGNLVGGLGDGLRVVTKAGGFGDPHALVDALDYVRGRLRPGEAPNA